MYFVFHCIVSFPFFVQYISSEFYIMIVYESAKIYQQAHTDTHIDIRTNAKSKRKIIKMNENAICYIFLLNFVIHFSLTLVQALSIHNHSFHSVLSIHYLLSLLCTFSHRQKISILKNYFYSNGDFAIVLACIVYAI